MEAFEACVGESVSERPLLINKKLAVEAMHDIFLLLIRSESSSLGSEEVFFLLFKRLIFFLRATHMPVHTDKIL